MPFLIDGHNLIGQMHDLSLSDPNDEAKLIAKLRQFAERSGKRMTVVFDPNPADTAPGLGHSLSKMGNLTVIYTQAGHKADDIIRAKVSEAKDKQGLIVVTSDAAVANFTRMNGIRVESSPEFIKRLRAAMSEQTGGYQKPQGSHREVQNWSEVFKEPETPPGAKPILPHFAKSARKKRKKSDRLAEQIKRVRPLF